MTAKNKGKIVYDPVDLNKDSYVEKVKSELDQSRELNALFLVHGYVEAYLSNWIFISGKTVQKREFSQTVSDSIERISFSNLLHVNLMLQNIDEVLYTKIKQFNKQRNDFAHELITIDVNEQKIKEKMKKIVKNGIDILEEVSKLYTKNLDERAKIVQ